MQMFQNMTQEEKEQFKLMMNTDSPQTVGQPEQEFDIDFQSFNQPNGHDEEVPMDIDQGMADSHQ